MSLRTNPDRILENIDRQRSRDEEAGRLSHDRQAVGRELDTMPPPPDATNPERMKRVFQLVEKAYTAAAQGEELGKLAARFRGIGDLYHHHARGDTAEPETTDESTDPVTSTDPDAVDPTQIDPIDPTGTITR